MEENNKSLYTDELLREKEENEKLKKELEQKQAQIDRLNKSLVRYSDMVNGLANEVTTVSAANDEIVSSFYWRLTGPMRRFTQALKNLFSRNKSLMAILIFLKCFLRNGYKQAIVKYREFKPIKKKVYSDRLHTITPERRAREEKYEFPQKIKFSILVPLYNTPKKFLVEMIQSAVDQTYGNWELCLADGSDDEHSYVGEYCRKLAENDKRIVYKKLEKNEGISENTNVCIKMATGDYIALFDHDDVLHPSALFEVMKAVCEKGAEYVYTDEATFAGENINDIITFHFKPDFAIDNLLANNYICHFSVFKASLLEKVGGFRSKYDGSQDHDLILRLTDAVSDPSKVVHVAKLLYFWRSHKNSVAMDINSKTYAIEAGKSAVHDFLESKGYSTVVTSTRAHPTIYHIQYEIKGEPKISVIIPNKNHVDDLVRCVESVLNLSTYKNYEIIIADNQSDDNRLFDYYKELSYLDNVKTVKYDKPFNYSAINNYAVSQATGEYLLFLNNDTEVISRNWLEEMLMYAQRDDVGAVGAKLYFGNNTVQHGGVILGLGADRIAGHSHYKAQRSNLGYMGKMCYAQDVGAVTAACMMVRRSVFEQVNGFDEALAVAYNDVDLCMKIRELGKNIVFNPYSELYHYESISRGLDTKPENVKRFNSEKEIFLGKWKTVLDKGDPYYNVNFSLDESYVIDEKKLLDE